MTDLLLKLFQWINNNLTGNFGFTIVLFTIAIRLVSLPFDIRARKGQREFSMKTAKLQPEIDRINKAYKNNPEVAQKKTLELRRSAGLGLMPKGCFAQFITYPLLIAFFAVFRNMAAIQTAQLASYVTPAGGLLNIDYVGVHNWFAENGFLWVKNIWMPDNAFNLNNIVVIRQSFFQFIFNNIISDIVPTGTYLTTLMSQLPKSMTMETSTVQNAMWAISQNITGHNGLFILPILAGAVQFISVKLSQKLMGGAPMADPSNPQAAQSQKTAKFMNIFFPILFTWFCLTSSSALAIYWITSSLLMLLTNFLINLVLTKKEAKQEALAAQGIAVAVKPAKENFVQKLMNKAMEQQEKLNPDNTKTDNTDQQKK